MSKLFTQVKADQLAARKGKAETALAASLLTTLIGEVTTAAKNDGNREVTDDDVRTLIGKFLKGINDSIDFMKGNDNAVALEMLEKEKAILTAYMPKQLSKEDLASIVHEFAGAKDVGAIMKYLRETYPNQYNGKLAAEVVKTFIGK